MLDTLDGPWQDVHAVLTTPATEPEDHTACETTIARLEQQLGSRREAPKPTAPEPAGPGRRTFGDLIDAYGPWLSLFAAIGLTASGEYSLAILAGWSRPIAWLLPSAIDIYVTVALRRHRDLIPALGLMVVANALYHLAAKRLFGTDTAGAPLWWLVVGVAAIAPYVMWRVHQLNVPAAAETKVSAVVSPRQQVSICSGAAGLALVSSAAVGDRSPRSPRSPAAAQAETSTRETGRETTETSARETRRDRSRETETTQATPRSRPRETTETSAVAIGDRESEILALISLMETGGDPMAVSLNDAIETTGRPKATAAKRLAAARDRYRKSA